MAEWTGLEPATLDVTGRYSNQLNYHSVSPIFLNPSLLREEAEFTETTSFLQLLCHQKKSTVLKKIFRLNFQFVA